MGDSVRKLVQIRAGARQLGPRLCCKVARHEVKHEARDRAAERMGIAYSDARADIRFLNIAGQAR